MLKTDLSIIIISYNTKDILYNCLKSIQESRIQLNYETIVVDNASTDGSPKMVKRKFKETILIKNKTNKMFSKANNQAIKIARGKHFLFLNSDTIIEPKNIEKMYKFIDTNQPNVACVGPRLINKDRSFQSEGGPQQNSIIWILATVFGIVYWPIPDKIKKIFLPRGYNRFGRGKCRSVGVVPGCCMLVSHIAINTIGMFDEDFIFYHEETEWCFRAWKNGFSVWVYPDAKVIHLKGASTTTNTLDRTKSMFFTQRQLFYYKTIGISYAKILNFIKIIVFLPGLLITRLIGAKQHHLIYGKWIRIAFGELKHSKTNKDYF